MNLTELKNEIDADNSFSQLRDQDWEDKIQMRGVYHMYPEDMDNALASYLDKIAFGRVLLSTGNPTLDEQVYWTNAIARMRDKAASIFKEQQLRTDGLVSRVLHHTSYYIDYVNGSDSADGLSTGNSWKTITKYTTVTVRSAGDIAYLRANTTWTQGTEAVDITIDENGTNSAYISVIGCDSVTNDPWSDSSDVKPIIDFEDSAYNMTTSQSHFWYWDRVQFIDTTDTNGLIYIQLCRGWYFKDVDFDGSTSAGTNVEGLNINGCQVTCENCTWANNKGTAILATSSTLMLWNCTVDAGVDGCINGISCNGSIVNMEGGSIAATYSFSTSNVLMQYGGIVRLRNVDWTYTDTQWYVHTARDGMIFSEDDNATFENQVYGDSTGWIVRDTTTVRSGGADSSAKMTPLPYCGVNMPLVLGEWMPGFAKIWATTSVQINISVYARVASAWASQLGASECFATFSYLSNGASAARTRVTSSQQVANDGTWTALTSGNITPARTGWVYIWLNLGRYEASKDLLVDIKPVVG